MSDGLDPLPVDHIQSDRSKDEVGQAEDPVHRGADLVAHIGEEGGFGAISGIGRLLAFAQLPFGLDESRDVGSGAPIPGKRSVRVENRDAADPQIFSAAIGVDGIVEIPKRPMGVKVLKVASKDIRINLDDQVLAAQSDHRSRIAIGHVREAVREPRKAQVPVHFPEPV